MVEQLIGVCNKKWHSFIKYCHVGRSSFSFDQFQTPPFLDTFVQLLFNFCKIPLFVLLSVLLYFSIPNNISTLTLGAFLLAIVYKVLFVYKLLSLSFVSGCTSLLDNIALEFFVHNTLPPCLITCYQRCNLIRASLQHHRLHNGSRKSF